jgi:CP family cyanate transporter-like MFS transporter
LELLESKANTKSTYIYFFIAGIVLIAFNLRPAITSLGPLVGMIQEDVGLAHWSAGLLMSLPLVVFAVMSPLVPKIASRITNELTLIIGLSFLLIGITIRSIPMTFFLFTGTLLAGMGIAIGNVLLPAVVKDKFPHQCLFNIDGINRVLSLRDQYSFSNRFKPWVARSADRMDHTSRSGNPSVDTSSKK